MEDLNRAGGVPALLHQPKPLLHLDAMTVTGKTLGAKLDAFPLGELAQDIIRPLDDPLFPT